MIPASDFERMLYLDHAATSWPKPPEVIRAMGDFCNLAGGNPGRSGHRLSLAASRVVYEAREAVAELFGVPDPLRVIFTANATHAINLALRGLLRTGDRVVTTGIEHNAVMRPLRALEQQGVKVGVIPCEPDGSIDLVRAAAAIVPGTRMVVVNHASNVAGTILPIVELARLAHDVGAWLLVDAAQTAGVMAIDVTAMGIDLLAFTGHKGLQGPMGTGGLVINNTIDTAAIEPLIYGGTGSRSAHETQPEFCPDKFESGTPNGVGIAGLGAGVRWVQQRGIAAIREHDQELARALVEGLEAIPGVVLYGPTDPAQRTATVSFTVAGRRVSEVGLRLDDEFDILCRVGLHCAPAAHRTLGTFPEGTARFAAGACTRLDEIRTAIVAVEQIVRP
jgi:cysteine desulfurase / selenocysteine lyase